MNSKIDESPQLTYQAYIDGSSRGNPGKAGAGISIENENRGFYRGICQFLGKRLTNNQAEYGALILLLREVVFSKHIFEDIDNLEIFSDSKLLVKQMRGEFKVKNKNIMKYHLAARKLLEQIKFPVKFHNIPRERNRKADRLANIALDLYYD